MTEVRLGDKRIPFIYQGNKLLQPNPVKDGLILWYDFSAMANSDISKGVAKDLSGNGHDGTLQNFNYTGESGYVGNGLKFDGVDDSVVYDTEQIESYTIEATVEWLERNEIYSNIIGTYLGGSNGGFNIYNYGQYLRVHASSSESSQTTFTISGMNVGDTVNVAVVMTTDKCLIYVSGELRGAFDFTSYQGMQLLESYKGAYLGRYYSRDLYMSQDVIHSAKIYNRPLTAEEIQHNYQLEKARFSL